MQSNRSLTRQNTRRQPLLKKKAFWLTVFLLAAAGAAAWYLLGMPGIAKPAAQAARQSDNHTTTVRRGNIEISAAGSGVLVANRSVDLNFPVRGTVIELDVTSGDMVKAGQVLARMGNSETLQAAVTALQYQLLQAQQDLANLQQNSGVALAQAYQDMVAAQDTLTTAQTTAQRSDLARCSKAVNTRDAQILAQAADKLANATQGTDEWVNDQNVYNQALANYNYCAGHSASEKTQAAASQDVARVSYQQAQDKYNTLKTANGVDPNQLQLDQARINDLQAQLDAAQANLKGLTLAAPMDGRVTFVAAQQGAIVGTAKYITIVDVSQPAVQISLDQTDLEKLQVGATSQVVFDALPNETLTGKVSHIEPALISQNNAQVAQGLVVLDDSAKQALQNLPLGANASVTVIDKQAQNALLVPNQALVDLGNNEYAVFLAGPGGDLKLTPVTVGISDGTHTEILSGLKDGDVISTGNAQVLPGG